MAITAVAHRLCRIIFAMLSPFAYLRGSAVMADDLSHTPVSGIQVAACGDMLVADHPKRPCQSGWRWAAAAVDPWALLR